MIESISRLWARALLARALFRALITGDRAGARALWTALTAPTKKED